MKNFIRDTLKLLTLFSAIALPTTLILSFMYDPIFALGTLAASLLLVVVTWIFYAEVMRLKRLRDDEELKLFHCPWALVILPIGLTLDAILNVVVGIYWREYLPKWRSGEWLLTARLKRWKADDSNPIRQAWATRICVKLNKHDEDHC